MKPHSRIASAFCSILLLAIVIRLGIGLAFQKTKGISKPSPAGAHPTKTEDTESAISSHLENGQRYLSEGKLQEALREYRLSLENDGENEAAHFGMALALTQLGKPEEAIRSYNAALELDPKLWEAEINWGMILFNRQDFSEALEHFKKARILNPKSSQSFLLEGKAQEMTGDFSAAVNSLSQALSLAKGEQERKDTHAALGLVYLKLRNWDEAEQHLEAARSAGKRDVPLELNLAQVYWESGKLKECVDLVKPLADANPQEVDAQEIMGRVLAQQGETAQAIHYYEQAAKSQLENDRRSKILLELATAYEKSGQTNKALMLLKGEASNSPLFGLHFRLGTLCLHEKDYDCAVRSFLTALKLNSDCIECYSNLGAVFLLAEKYPEAIVAFTKFKTSRPDVPGTYFYLGLAYDKLGDIPNAMTNYRRFLELDQGKTDKQDFQARERLKVLTKIQNKR